MESSYYDRDFCKMADYYPLLVEACIEFNRYSRRHIIFKKGKKNPKCCLMCTWLLGGRYEEKKHVESVAMA